MQNLPWDQIVHIGAAQQFANLAASQESRPRRRRERRHATQSSPYRFPPVPSQFSHIQIVTQAIEEKQQTDRSSPEPVFRKPSLMQETERPTLGTIKSTDSLANNIQGTTFAARARAAELQAARARKELKSTIPSTSVPSPTHELMAFKSKAKTNRTAWKRVDLVDVSGGNDGTAYLQREGSEGDLSSIPASKNASSENLSTTFDLHSDTSALKILDRPQVLLRSPLSGPSSIAPSIDEADDVDLQNEETQEYSFTAVSGSNDQGKGKGKVESGDIVGTTSMPTGPYGFEQAESPGLAASEHFYSQIAQDGSSHSTREDLFDPISTVGFEGSHHTATTSGPVQQAYQTPLRNDLNHPFGHHNYTQPQQSQSSYIAYTQPAHIPPLKSKPPSHYPAVKGTTITSSAFATPALRLSNVPVLAAQPPAQDNERDDMPQVAFHDLHKESSMGHGEPPVSLKPGTTILPKSNASRTVLNDPFAVGSRSSTVDRHHNESPARADLYRTSHELPWKERIASIATPRLCTVDSWPTWDKYKLTSQGAIELSPDRISGEIGRPIDDRFEPGLLDEMNAFLTRYHGIAPTSSARLRAVRIAAEHDAYLHSNFSEDRATLERNMSTLSLHSKIAESSTQHPQQPATDSQPMATQFVAHDIKTLLLPALASLHVEKTTRDYFTRYVAPPDWCIDHGPDADKSFFGGDWGAPPQRVGRDPRYQFRASSSPLADPRNNSSSPGSVAGGMRGGYMGTPTGPNGPSYVAASALNYHGPGSNSPGAAIGGPSRIGYGPVSRGVVDTRYNSTDGGGYGSPVRSHRGHGQGEVFGVARGPTVAARHAALTEARQRNRRAFG